MKKIINILLGLCVVGLLYIVYASIMNPIKFDREREKRERAVINRLIDIRSAQVEFRNQNQGQYTASFDSLINFVKVGKLPVIKKIGELTDKQIDEGWTESKVVSLYRDAKEVKIKSEAKKLWDEAAEAGFVEIDTDGNIEYIFSRDTVWVDLIDSLYHNRINPDSLRYVPYGKGVEFEMEIGCDTTKSGSFMFLFEARTPYTTFLKGIDDQELYNLIDEREQLGRYTGLKVGDAKSGNNNAGNWE